ncbi:MAG: HU family DNA-binding protein, partial [Actinomycetota bacterium]|nr:HU family DNA-binding protein [Actinomycetota bacterium]
MNKRRLVEEIASRTHLPPRDVAKVIDALIEVVTGSVAAGEKIVLSGFGTFHRKTRAERTARDIPRGEPVKVEAMDVPAFRA